MEIILKENIDNLGEANEIVNVKPGFARNFLIPNGKAIVATPSQKKVLAETLRQRAHKLAKVLDEAAVIAAKLAKVSLKIGAKAGENGKIFGSVNTIQLSEALAKAGFSIDRKDISIAEDAIKELGTYEAKIKLHKSVIQAVKFDVVGE
ncbi:MAG: large subunit ribosomal protein L9 [Flavobacteriales bacterium]|jgi:large subunit ribosomal protein L9